MDALSEILKFVRLEGAVFLDAEFTAPWCVRAKFGLADAQLRLGQSHQVVFFHWLAEGQCKVRLSDSAQTLEAVAGDLILFPHDDRHLVGSDLQLSPVESLGPSAASHGGISRLKLGGGGARTRFICGYIACNREVLRPLLDVLPRMLLIPIGLAPAGVLLREVLRTGVSESASARDGSSSTLAKLAELLFVEALRRYAESQPGDARGWLAGASDPQIGRVLTLLHGDPGRDWTVDELARHAALSRSSLAERFTALVGESPIHYLTRLRLAVAAQALRSGGGNVGRIAQRSGYESEAAFSRAFKREFGVSPSSWRRSQSQKG